MAGRIFGYLLISDPPEQSAEEIARSVLASRASVSTMTRMLIQGGLIERTVKPGRRQDLFRIPPEAYVKQIGERARLIRMFREALEGGIEALKGEKPERGARLREMYNLYHWLEREYPLLLERYRRENGGAP